MPTCPCSICGGRNVSKADFELHRTTAALARRSVMLHKPAVSRSITPKKSATIATTISDCQPATQQSSSAMDDLLYTLNVDALVADLSGMKLSIADRVGRNKENAYATVKSLHNLKTQESRLDRCLEQIEAVTSIDGDVNESAVHEFESLVSDIGRRYMSVSKSTPKLDAQKILVRDKLATIDLKIDELRERAVTSTDPLNYDCDYIYASKEEHPLALTALTITMLFRVILQISRRSGDFLIQALSYMYWLAFTFSTAPNGSHSVPLPLEKDILNQLPKQIRTVMKNFDLGGKFTVYAVCPRLECMCTYNPKFTAGSELPIYPELCTNIPSPNDPPCKQPLLTTMSVGGKKWRMPIKTFLYHHIDDWIARLLARKDLEQDIDDACDNAMLFHRKQADPATAEPDPLISHVFNGSYVQTFVDHTGQKLFIDRGSECRMLLSLNTDGFNVNRVLAGGASTTSTIIAAACLNLRGGIRYLPRYMYLVGVISGPDGPNETRTNHFVRPLVNDLCTGWGRGVQLSRTALHPEGRLVRYGIAPFVMDLVATRKTLALAAHNAHHFCSACPLYGRCVSEDGNTIIDERSRVDHHLWGWKDGNAVRAHAETWRDASSNAQRKDLFDAHGTRYTPFHQLPYTSLPRQIVPDIMHNHHEGTVPHHFLNLLCLREGGDAKEAPAYTFPFKLLPDDDTDHIYSYTTPKGQVVNVSITDKNHVKAIHRDLTAKWFETLHARLAGRNKWSLMFVCDSLGLLTNYANYMAGIGGAGSGSFTVTKKLCATLLVAWRRTMPLEADAINTSDLYKVQPVLEAIRRVITETEVPTSVGSVPRQFGSKSEGTLGADEWRTLAAVHLPLALIQLWGSPIGDVHDDGEGKKLLELLDNTMDLVIAIRLAALRVTNKARANVYLAYICRYVKTIQVLFPNNNIVTNHHMAIHVYDFLLLYGPPHSWWCYPFERLIGKLQGLSSNHKWSQLETTLTQTFVSQANLLRWFDDPGRPKEIQHLKELYDACMGQGIKGTVNSEDAALLAVLNTADTITDQEEEDNMDLDYGAASSYSGDETCLGEGIWSAANSDAKFVYRATEKKIPPKLHEALEIAEIRHSSTAHFQGRLRLDGVIYSTCQAHTGNSNIAYLAGGGRTSGQIEHIFTTSRETFVAVKPFIRLPCSEPNPYSRYEDHYPAMSVYAEPSSVLQVIRPRSICCHVARWQMDGTRAVVLSLSKVD